MEIIQELRQIEGVAGVHVMAYRQEEYVAELDRAVETASENSNVRAVVFTGAGRAFCSGADLTSLTDYHSGVEGDTLARGIRQAQGVFDKVEALPQPTIQVQRGIHVIAVRMRK